MKNPAGPPRGFFHQGALLVKLIKFLPHAGIVGVLATIMQFMDMKIADLFVGWIGFAAWACYFLNGCTLKGGVKVIGCWIGGVIASIMIMELGKFLTGATDGNALMGFPVSVGVVAFLVILFEKVPVLSFIPGWFVAAACFFGYHTNDYSKSVLAVLISCVVGQIFGYVTVSLRTAYGKAVEKADAK
jgi:hypothetical protein